MCSSCPRWTRRSAAMKGRTERHRTLTPCRQAPELARRSVPSGMASWPVVLQAAHPCALDRTGTIMGADAGNDGRLTRRRQAGNSVSTKIQICSILHPAAPNASRRWPPSSAAPLANSMNRADARSPPCSAVFQERRRSSKSSGAGGTQGKTSIFSPTGQCSRPRCNMWPRRAKNRGSDSSVPRRAEALAACPRCGAG